MSSTNWAPPVRLGSQVPRVLSHPPYSYSAAPEVIDLYEAVAKPLDPWQKLALTHGLGVTSAHEWAALKIACWVARQNGKGGVIEALELAWLFLPGMQQRYITHSAHKYQTAQEAFRRIKAIIDGSDMLSSKVKAIRETNGEQGVELMTGERLAFMARTRTGARGLTAPRVILDEAQELDDDMMASAMPTMSAQPDPQVWFFGTPPDRPDAWVYGLKEDGEAGADDLCWLDWSALDLTGMTPEAIAEACANIDLAYAANPALGKRITEKFVRSEQRPSGLGARYVYERLGAWRPRSLGGAGVIAEAQWKTQVDRKAERPALIAFAIGMNPDRTQSTIAAAGRRPDGHYQLLVIDTRPGTSWVVDRMVELKAAWNPVAIALDAKGPASSLIKALEDAGIALPNDEERPRRGDLMIPTLADLSAWFGLFVDGVRDGVIWHADEGPLNLALRGAKTRTLTGGGSTWDVKGSADISPLVASNLALGALIHREPLVVASTYDLLQSVW
jgi:hypothetical protein